MIIFGTRESLLRASLSQILTSSAPTTVLRGRRCYRHPLSRVRKLRLREVGAPALLYLVRCEPRQGLSSGLH